MKKIIPFLSIILSVAACGNNVVETSNDNQNEVVKLSEAELQEFSTAYFASGCFWCVEAIYESVRGVKEAVSGYAGGKEENPTYQQVGSGMTSHTEAVMVYYDADEVSYETLVKVYYGSHDPTTVNGQKPDFGTQYRSMILYQNEEEKNIAETFKANLETSGEYSKPIATQIEPLVKFWPAEDYHQDYERKNPDNSYVKNVSVPRLNEFLRKYPDLLKEGGH
jgi:peptide-methionine (S)-S-oxide reductase